MKVLITGGSRGIGLEFVRQLAMREDKIFVGVRNPDKSPNLASLQKKYKNLIHVFPLDVSSKESILEAFDRISRQTSSLDLLINNAGIISGTDKKGLHTVPLGELHTEDLVKVFKVNSIAPILITERFLPLLERGSSPKVINVTSRLGSITLSNGGYLSYRASKAALNMFTKSIAPELRSKGIIAVVIHPGWVRTEMGGPGAPLTPEESVSGMLSVIDRLSVKDAGKFLDYQGNELPW